jgi:archaellum biogenesis protein FlaJ (TadC family)
VTPSSEDRLVRIVVAVFAVEQLALGALMAVAPGSFFHHVGPFGLRNDHYIRDSSTWSLALGAALLIALRRPRWRVPVLAFAALQAALHALNHLADIGKAHPRYVGPLDFGLLALTAVLLAYVARRAAGGGETAQ